MQSIMEKLYEIFAVKLGWAWIWELAPILLIVAALLLVILLLTIIIAAAVGGSRKKKIKKLQKEQSSSAVPFDEQEIYARARAELEPQIRDELQNEYKGRYVSVESVSDLNDELRAISLESFEDAKKINELNALLEEKDRRIEELGYALNTANSTNETDSHDYGGEIYDLTQTNKQLQHDIDILKAENAQLRSQARSSGPAAPAAAKVKFSDTEQAKKQQAAAAKTKKPAAKVDEDDEDEIDNEFGDENSAIKVTLKFDKEKNNWVIYRSDTTRAYRRMTTKQDAVMVAKDLARRLHAQLVVHKKDGKFQRV